MANTLERCCLTFGESRLQRTCMIVDASESTDPHRPVIAALVRQVLAALPVDARPQLFFLGSGRPYPVEQFAAQMAGWFDENRTRASLVTPIWETFDPEAIALTVIIGAGRIFDLEDWAGTNLLKQTVLVSWGPSLQGDERLADELVSPAPEQVVSRLHDPPRQVRITGPGFMPTGWTNPGYRIELTDGAATLVAENLQDFSVTLEGFVLASHAVQASVTRASGKQAASSLVGSDRLLAVEAGAVGTLTPPEAAAFRQAGRRQPFSCPLCKHQHAWNIIRCDEGAIILGDLIYPSLRDAPAGSFVVFEERADAVQFRIHPCGVLDLGQGRVAVRRGASAYVFEFELEQGVWTTAEEEFAPYEPLQAGNHAILT